MTTGRINQVTVLHARSQREPHKAADTGALARSPARVSHRPIKSSLRHRTRGAPRPLGRSSPQSSKTRVPSPPISHASGAFPRSRGPESTPSVKTTDERPLLQRGLPERGVSPSGWLQTELAIGYQVHIPLHRSQSRQKHPASLPSGSKRVLTQPAL